MGKRLVFLILHTFVVHYVRGQSNYSEHFDNVSKFTMNWQRHDLDSNGKCGWVFMPYSSGYPVLDFFKDNSGILQFHAWTSGLKWNTPRIDDFIVNKVPINFNQNDSLVLWVGASLGNFSDPDYAPDTIEVYLRLLDTSWINRPLLLGNYRHLQPFMRIITYANAPYFQRYSFPLKSLLAVGNTSDSALIIGFRKRASYYQNSFIDNISIESPQQLSSSLLTIPKVTVYPNPGTNEILFRSEFPISEITLSNMIGQVVLKKQQPGTELSASELPNGVYIYEIITSGHRVVGKWVKR